MSKNPRDCMFIFARCQNAIMPRLSCSSAAYAPAPLLTAQSGFILSLVRFWPVHRRISTENAAEGTPEETPERRFFDAFCFSCTVPPGPHPPGRTIVDTAAALGPPFLGSDSWRRPDAIVCWIFVLKRSKLPGKVGKPAIEFYELVVLVLAVQRMGTRKPNW